MKIEKKRLNQIIEKVMSEKDIVKDGLKKELVLNMAVALNMGEIEIKNLVESVIDFLMKEEVLHTWIDRMESSTPYGRDE